MRCPCRARSGSWPSVTFSAGPKRTSSGAPNTTSSRRRRKVRRGKVGGYRDYFTPDELARIDAYIEDHLAPAFAYGTRLAEAS